MFNVSKSQMEKMMKQMGIKNEEIDANEVIIKCSNKNLVIRNPHVTKISMQGNDSLQITGDIEEVSAGFSDEDVKTIMNQTGCTEADAKAALEETNDIAAAILKLSE